ncbi:DUF397 domain-containing protein [Amycolatopsis suaedae]|uniref:DUF397 domain-containing protein n=1 Tax=Amycolatopsis suaedae TaxID=2510978 RepID=A0A4V2ELY4_9PSEU|nr:DUF397 domain-containing protein [Amycolatopsis suaedae]RZQ63175.1 DUF397 domain-containing protein [Amycolatopsis suaedae]
MSEADKGQLVWRKSSYSGGGNDCVEVAFTGDGAAVRDSKDIEGGSLTFSPSGWLGLLDAVRSGSLRQ